MNLKSLFLSLFIICLFGQQKSYAQCPGIVTVGDTVYVNTTSNVGSSLRAAILCVNDPGNSVRFIHFNINDPGVITLQPSIGLPLPAITKANVVIDARTEPGWYLGKIILSANLAGDTNGLTISSNNVSIYGLTIIGFTNSNRGGIFIGGGTSNTLLEQNALNGNQHGIQTTSPFSFTVRNNFIGIDPVTNASDGNLVAGINILTSASGAFVIEDNTIANNPTGILAASSLVDVLASENSIFCNSTKGIERSGFSVSGFDIDEATTRTISGNGPNGALVEVFIHDNTGCPTATPCQGKTFVESTTVSGGSWAINVTLGDVQLGDEITATATIGGDNTSEFLSCLTATCPPASVVFSAVQDACGDTPSGSATASVSIAGSFTYEWSDGQMNATAIDLLPDTYTVTATDATGCAYIGNITIDELDLPSVNPFGSTPLCIGDTLFFESNASGGSPPYTAYNWQGPDGYMSDEEEPSRLNIQLDEGGTYSLTVTDANGCEGRGNAMVDVNAAPTFDLSAQNISCNGASDGNIDLTPIAITPPATFLWSNAAVTEDIANLGPGTYTVTVTDGSGCMASDSRTIEESPVLLISNVQTSAPSTLGGSDGSVNFDINGGATPYSYSWTGPVNGSDNLAAAGTASINNLSAGDYNLVLTDANGCMINQAFAIAAFNCMMSISNNTVTPVSCAGGMDGSIDITLANATPPVTYNWDNGAMTEDIANLGVGTYSLTATDVSGCEVLFSAPVTAPTALSISNMQSTTPTSMGGNDGTFSFDINGGTAPYAYSWTGPVNGSDNLAAAGTATINNLLAGNYNIVLTDGNSCMLNQAFTISSFDCDLMISGNNIINESCAGEMDGSISLTVNNGTPPYNYSWTNGVDNDNGTGTIISGLAAANYDITISDQDNCVVTTSLEVSTVTLPDPGSTTSSSCDEGGGMAIFDLSALESIINPNPGLTIVWFEDAAGTMPIADPSSYTSSGGLVYAATSQGSCLSSLVSSQLVVLPQSDPACMTGGCTSFAGTFSATEPQTVCDFVSVADLYNNDAVLDDNDLLVFILHTQAGENLGAILAMEASPTATFDLNTMDYGVTYYLTAVVGDNNGSGSIDLSDLCLSVASGQAVIFSEMLSGVLNFIQGEEELCQGEDLFLSTNVLTGLGLTYHWILPAGDTLTTSTANLLIESIQPLDAGDYYVFVQDGSCLFDQTGPFSLIVLGLALGEQIDAGRDTVICERQYTLNAAPISTGNGSWFGPAGVTISSPNTASTLVSELEDGVNQFIWTVNTAECGTIGTDTMIVVVANGLQAEDDFFTLAQANDEIFMDVLKNDDIPDQASYTLRALTQPEFGELLTLPHGFQYFETEGRRGIVTFVYELCYTNGNCASSCDTATVTIEVLNLPYLPEGFSPNGDGTNDLLKVLGYIDSGDISMRIKITNRWGDIVYEADDYLQELPWDGRMNNNKQPLPEGTYYAWLEITVDGVVYQQSQPIYLIY